MILFKPRLDVDFEKITADNFGRCILAETIIDGTKMVLGADHLTLEGGGGVGDFEKKFPASTFWKKKIACSTKEREKNSCTATSKEKMLQSYFIIPGGLYKIPAKLQPFQIICKPASHSD